MGAHKLGTQRLNYAAGTIGHWTCLDGNSGTQVTDSSGQGNHLDKGAGLLWTTDGTIGVWDTDYRARTRYNTGDTDDFRLILANAAFSEWNTANGDSLVIAFRAAIATPAAQVPIFGNSYMTTAGLRLRCTAAQKLVVSAYEGPGGPSAVSTDVSAAAIGGGTERYHMIGIDGIAGTVTYWQNGARDTTIDDVALFTPGASLVAPTLSFGVGGAMESPTNVGSCLIDFAEINIVRRAGRGLPSNIDTIAEAMYRHRYLPITADVGW